MPDADLNSSTANGECGALSNSLFGTPFRNTFFAKDVLEGWGNRGDSWQASVSVQHELLPGVALNVGYFRTQFGNFTVTDNELVTSADFDPYCITAPVDARLPGGGGNELCGLYDISPGKFGQVRNLVTQASNFGEQEERYDGVDIGFSARFPQGGFLGGGVSIGRRVTDNCFVVDSPQQARADFCRDSPLGRRARSISSMASTRYRWTLRPASPSRTYRGGPCRPLISFRTSLFRPRWDAICRGVPHRPDRLIPRGEVFLDRPHAARSPLHENRGDWPGTCERDVRRL